MTALEEAGNNLPETNPVGGLKYLPKHWKRYILHGIFLKA
jgi:hypothetical protein